MPEDRRKISLLFALIVISLFFSLLLNADKFAEVSANETYNLTGAEVSNEGMAIDLINKLETGDHETQLEAAAELGEIGQPAADALIEKIENKTQNQGKINSYMLLALLETGDKRAEDILLRSFQEKEADRKAVNSMAEEEGRREISEDMQQATEARGKALRKHIADSLNSNYKEKTDELEEALKSEEQDYNAYASIALSEFGPQEPGTETEKLLRALKSEDGNIRLAAIMALGEKGEEAAVEPMNQLLVRDYPLIRKSASFALGKIGSESGVEALLKEMKASEEEYVRSSAAISLGEIGAEESVPYLIERLRDKKVGVRSAAALSLGIMGNETAISPMIEVLESGKDSDEKIKSTMNSNSDLRKSIVLALGEIGSSEATEALISIMNDGNETLEVRTAAASSLGEIGDPTAVEALGTVINDKNTNKNIRNEAFLALSKNNDQKAAEIYIEKLSDNGLKDSAREILIGMGEEAVDPLIETLETGDQELKTEAALILIEIGNKKAVEPLIRVYQ